jgi:hypothetical protein
MKPIILTLSEAEGEESLYLAFALMLLYINVKSALEAVT